MGDGARLISTCTFVQPPQCPIAAAQQAIDGDDFAEKEQGCIPFAAGDSTRHQTIPQRAVA